MAYLSTTFKFSELETPERRAVAASALKAAISAEVVPIEYAEAVVGYLHALRKVPVKSTGGVSASANANIDVAVSVTTSLYTLKVSVGP